MMETSISLSDFFSAIENDCRISITHIGIYAALLKFRMDKGWGIKKPIEAFSYEIMHIAKISGANTYHKYIRELNEFGYIKYEPSYKNNQRSRIYLIENSQLIPL